MNRKFKFLLVLLAIVFMLACTQNLTVKSYYDMTSKEKLTYIYQIYNAQHEDYVSMSKMSTLTEGQKQIMRKKKPILENLQTLIPVYDSMVVQGTPSASKEKEIYDLLNSLQSLVPAN